VGSCEGSYVKLLEDSEGVAEMAICEDHKSLMRYKHWYRIIYAEYFGLAVPTSFPSPPHNLEYHA